jgi:sec-independent protein translocase protein TatA
VPNLGLSELIVIFMILLLVFGASRLPALGESLGRTIRGFKRGMAGNDDIEVQKQVGAGAKPGNPEVAEAELVDKKKV